MKPLDWPDFGHLRQALLATTCLVVAGVTLAPPVAAAPAGLSVGSGQVTVGNPNAQTTLIQQGTNKAVLNWNSFSIGRSEQVIFQQPNASSVALNRVTGSQPSSIFGHLTANGQVFLLNPNGILFGRNSVVSVAGLVATTSGIKDSDFLAGNYNFGIASPNPNAGVVNHGSITAADGGSVVLSGNYVENSGLIQARLGKVVLAGTTTFAVDFAGDNLLSFAVTGPVTQVPVDQNGNPVTSLVSNTGSIIADGGQVTLTARAAKGILDNVINTSGMIEANTASMVNGTIVLDAGDGGVTVGGGLSASGLGSGETGGTIKVLGGAVTIGSGAVINASGDAGGGNIAIGGDFHGAGPNANAWTTNVQQGATILADAITTGNGGNVAVWADGYTAFNGTISAQGGALSGNGGFVETSGHQGLSIQTGSVNTLAPNGQAGTWLLDPMNITVVSSSGTATLAQESSFTSGGGNDTINASTIDAATSNVTLQAQLNITFNAGVVMSTGTVGLTAQAGESISFASGAGIVTKGGAVTLSANDPASPVSRTGTGSITFADTGISTTGRGASSATLTSGSTSVSVASSSGMAVGDSVRGPGIPSGTTITAISGNTLTLSNAASGSGSNVEFVDIGATGTGGGAITLRTNGGSGAINLGTAGLITAGGAITLNGSSISSSTGSPGISSAGTNANGAGAGGNITLTSTSGDINLAGGIEATGGIASNIGRSGGVVQITSAGAVDIGSGMSIVTSGSGAQLTSDTSSINVSGFLPSNSTSQTAGNAGSISVTAATNLTLDLGANAVGGNALVSGSAQNGGSGGTITLNANGDVKIGGDSTGSIIGLIVRGGDSRGGSGGNAGSISATGQDVSVGGKLSARGGDTFASSGVSGGNGGNITLTATGTFGGTSHSIQLFGSADSPTDTNPATIGSSVNARGGEIGITQQFSDTGTVTGSGGNITLQGSGGGALVGDVLLKASDASSLNGGSTVGISVGGGSPGTGGALVINGAVNAAAANTESLRLFAGNGTATITGAVGTGTALNSLVFGSGISNLGSGTGGAITLQGPVTVGTQISDLRGSGSLTFNGFITTPLLTMPHDPDNAPSASLAMLGGGVFSGDIKTSSAQSISLAGNFTFTSSFTGNLSGGQSPAFVITGPGSLDTSATGQNLIISSVFSNSPFALNTGSGNLTINSVSSSSGAALSLRGSGTDTIFATSGPVVYDLRNFSGTAQITGGTILKTNVPVAAAPSLIPPPPPPPPFSITPPAPVIQVLPPPVQVTTVSFTGPTGPSSDNSPTTVQGTDTGGSMFSQISPDASNPGGSSGGTGSTSGSSTTTTTASNTSSPGGSTGGTRGPSGPGGTTGSTTTASNTPTQVPDTGDRAMSVIAQPPPVQPASRPLPAPPRVTASVIPGFVSQVQHPVVPKSGTPGVQQSFSASGNSGRW